MNPNKDSNTYIAGEWLLACGRDRAWSVFGREKQPVEENDQSYALVNYNDKAHTRIVWQCSWAWNGLFFGTASRDKTIKIWHRPTITNSSKGLAATLKTEQPVTAIAFSTQPHYVFAAGLENGGILIYKGTDNNDTAFKVVMMHKIAD
ncbi:hypothetical protein HDU93_005820, partial [Gonapodya sp. JEL0774]